MGCIGNGPHVLGNGPHLCTQFMNRFILIIGRLGWVVCLSWPYGLGNGPHVLGNGSPVFGNGPHLFTQVINTWLFSLWRG